MPRKKGMTTGLSPVKRLTSGEDQQRQPSPASSHPPPRRKVTSCAATPTSLPPPVAPGVDLSTGLEGPEGIVRAGVQPSRSMTPHSEDTGDLRYHHKKFKKMATTVGVTDADVSSSVTTSDTGWESPSPSEHSKSSPSPTASVNGTSGSGRYVCPYCKMACAKPSVLQKHIRAHTNERPYPCVPCGFAFKTKSNLYKHRRSRAHLMKASGSGQQEGSSEMMPTPSMSVSDAEEDGDEDGSPSCPTPETPPLNAPHFLNSIPGAAYSPPSIEKPLRPGIYKPKFHTALYDSNAAPMEVSQEPELPTSRPSSPSFTRKISVSPLCYSPGAPSPEFLQRHISKIISENQAIVETMDPLWPRRYLRQNSGREESRSPEPQNLVQAPWPSRKLLRQVSAGPLLSASQENKVSLESISSSTPPPHSLASQANSRLALALLRPKQDESSPPVMTLQGGATVTLEPPNNKLPPQPQPAPSPQQPLNLSVNHHVNNNINHQHQHLQQTQSHASDSHRKRCISDSVAVAPTGVRELLANYWSQPPHKLARFMADCPPGDKNFHPQNPEGSIIKDLLLKARSGMDVVDLLNHAENNAALYTMGDELHSSSQAFLCNLCKISYRNAENLEIHQRYYCKGLDQILHVKEDSRRTPKHSPHSSSSPRSTPRSKSREEASKMAAAVELVALATPPPFPSPGPLLGSTPLVGGYNSSKEESPPLKKRRVHSISEDRPPSTGSLRSLEELSRSPMQHHRPNSLQMFGGKVHINDGSETKTMIIDPSRGVPNSSSLMSMPNINQDDNHHGDGSGNRKSPTNIVVTIARSNLNSGGTIVQKAGHSNTSSSSCTSVSYSVSSITSTLVPDQQLLAAVSRPIVPKIHTPSLAPTLHHHLSPYITSHMSKMTAYNPLTLPTNSLSVVTTPQRVRSPDGVVTILHGGREIPYVPGMPGPQSLSESRPLDLACSPSVPVRHITEPVSKRHPATPTLLAPIKLSSTAPTSSHPEIIIKCATSPPATPSKMVPPKSPQIPSIKVEPDISLSVPSCLVTPSISTVTCTTSTASSVSLALTETSESSSKKFLRPTSLPLKPGTYTLKKPSSLTSLSGTTLISPETPRPRKSYGQLYLNGHAYTYLGLKCSTRVFFCCLNQPQPMYVPQSTAPRLSMYSNWKVCAPSIEPPSELVGSPDQAIALYDSRHRPAGYTVARSRQLPLVITHSSQWKKGLPPKLKQDSDSSKSKDCSEETTTTGTKISSTEGTSNSSGESAPKRVKIFAGGFESNEEYTYVRGRGRGRYVCEECGIRCKKPSMLKKHIRTHTDVRPFTCKHCSFSFKTKGNLTKHMKSKAHYKKCVELGIVPVPTVVDDSYIDEESLAKQQALRSARGDDAETESDEEDEDEEEDEEEDDDDGMPIGDGENCTSRPEREAACSLLSLSDQHAGLIPISARPSTYPYSYGPPSSSSIAHTPTIVGPVSAHSEREKVSRNTRLAGPPTGIPKSSAASSTSGRVVVGDSSRYYFPSRRDQSSPPSDDKNMEVTTTASSDEVSVSRSASVVSVNSSLSCTPPPMDLSRTSSDMSRPSTQQSANVCTPHTPVTPVPDSAALLAALCSTVERLPSKLPSAPSTAEGPAETTMLQAYLTERALQDTRIKQHQVHRWKGYNVSHGSAASTPTTPTTPLMPHSPLIWSGQSSVLTPTLTNVPSSILMPSPIKKFSPETVEKSFLEVSKVEVTSSVSVLTATMSASVVTTVSEHQSHKPVVTQSEITSRKLIAIGQQHVAAAAAAAAAAGGSPPHSSSPGKPKAEFLPPSSGPSSTYASVTEDGKSICVICNKVFSKPSQLRLHVNIHYFERPFRCESCAVSFRTKGHLQKHERSVSHQNKVSMNSTFGMPTTDNPRPFKCEDCKIAFRIHGHLAKHLRSKMHIMKLECLGKLPFGTYAEMERSGINLNEIDTTDCDNSLESLQNLAQKLYEKDPSKLQQWDPRVRTTSESSEDIDDIGEHYSAAVMAQNNLAAMAGNASSGEEGVAGPPLSQSRLSQHMSGSDYDETSDGDDTGQELQQLNCPACEQSFPSIGSLKVHMFVEHDSAGGGERAGMLQDLRAGTTSPGRTREGLSPALGDNGTDIESRKFRCDLCGLLLRNQESLKSHVASHAQPRPFVCEFCDAGFTSKTLLLGHLVLHQASGSPHAPITAATNCSF